MGLYHMSSYDDHYPKKDYYHEIGTYNHTTKSYITDFERLCCLENDDLINYIFKILNEQSKEDQAYIMGKLMMLIKMEQEK